MYKVKGGGKISAHKVNMGTIFECKKVKIMYALYAYIHYILMLLAYFIFWSRGDRISVHNNQRGIQFQYIIIDEGHISVHINQGGQKWIAQS